MVLDSRNYAIELNSKRGANDIRMFLQNVGCRDTIATIIEISRPHSNKTMNSRQRHPTPPHKPTQAKGARREPSRQRHSSSAAQRIGEGGESKLARVQFLTQSLASVNY